MRWLRRARSSSHTSGQQPARDPDRCTGKGPGRGERQARMHCWRKKSCMPGCGTPDRNWNRYKEVTQYGNEASVGHAAAWPVLASTLTGTTWRLLYGPGGAFVCKHDHRIWRVCVWEARWVPAAARLAVLFGPVLVFAAVRGVLRYAEQACNHFIAFKLALIRDKVFGCPAKLEGRDKGDLINVITSDIELLEVFYAHTISPVCIAVLYSAEWCGSLGSYHWGWGCWPWRPILWWVQ